jgi:hypothetical protein
MENNNESKQEIKALPRSSIETIDEAFFRYIDEKLNISCTTSDGFKKVPVIWANSERAFQIKNNVKIRDSYGSLIPPIISIDRKNISKDPSKKGTYQANLAPKDNRIVYTQEINQEKTSNFANSDTQKKVGQLSFITSKKNKKKVFTYKSVLLPVYVMIDYEINVLTNYLQQMNEIIQPFITNTAGTNYFVITHESFRYECFIQQDFNQESEISAEEERKYKTTILVKVLGQLIGDDVNQDIPTSTSAENIVEFKFPKESNLIIEDESKKKRKTVSNPGSLGPELVSVGNVIKKTFLIGDGINSTYTVTHDLNSRDMYVNVRETAGDYNMVFAGVSFVSLNSISINFGSSIGVNSHLVTIIS